MPNGYFNPPNQQPLQKTKDEVQATMNLIKEFGIAFEEFKSNKENNSYAKAIESFLKINNTFKKLKENKVAEIPFLILDELNINPEFFAKLEIIKQKALMSFQNKLNESQSYELVSHINNYVQVLAKIIKISNENMLDEIDNYL